MQRIDLDPPELTLSAWSREARPIKIGRLRLRGLETRETCEALLRRAHISSWAARVDDILFGVSATALLLVPLVVLPLSAWLR